MEIVRINPFRRKNRAAFSGNMYCPRCSRHVDPTTTPIGFENDKTKLSLVENVGPFVRVYQCRICGGKFRYDVNARQTHPYSSFKRGLRLRGLRYRGRVPILRT